MPFTSCGASAVLLRGQLESHCLKQLGSPVIWCTWWTGQKWQPTPVFLPGKSHGQRSLAAYRAWGCQSRAWQQQNNNNTLTKDLWAVLAQNPEHSWSDDLSTESEKTTHTKVRLWNVGDPETALRSVMNLKRTTKHKENEEAKAVKRENLIQQLSQKEAKHPECESH